MVDKVGEMIVRQSKHQLLRRYSGRAGEGIYLTLARLEVVMPDSSSGMANPKLCGHY